MSKQAEKVKHELQEELNKFSTLRAQIKKLVEARNKLDVQLNENRLVKEELDLLEDDAKTFKVVGPVLMKIELKDARADVNTRIDYIQNEMNRQEKTIEQLNDQQKKQQEVCLKLEQSLNKLAPSS